MKKIFLAALLLTALISCKKEAKETETSTEEPKKSVNEFDQKLAEDKAEKESASKVQDASQQFDDLFNN